MNISSFQSLAPLLPADQAILLRGPTGIGKSASVKAIAESLGQEMIDVRLAVMDEGTMGGIPNFEEIKATGIVHNAMYGWFVSACTEQVVLFLDELNRAMIPVLQSAFQIVLDRELGNGPDGKPYRLHPLTRVIAAGNFGPEYESEDLDPAMLRRFLVVDVEATVKDWLGWAKGRIDPVLVDFLSKHNVHWRLDPREVSPGTVIPCPATWDRLDTCLKHMGAPPSSWVGKRPPAGTYAVAKGLVGTEAAIAFADFVERYEFDVSGDDVMNNWENVKEAVDALSAERKLSLVDQIADYSTDNTWTSKQVKNVGKFCDTLGGEEIVNLWTKISSSRNLDNIKPLHSLIGARVVEAVQKSRNV